MSATGDRGAVGAGSRLGRLLTGAHGYTVRAKDGRRLGHLLWLTYDIGEVRPAGLRVQPDGWGGLRLSSSWEIPLERVIAVVPRRREVIVGAEGAPSPRRRP